jgi:hypothetical protein
MRLGEAAPARLCFEAPIGLLVEGGVTLALLVGVGRSRPRYPDHWGRMGRDKDEDIWES